MSDINIRKIRFSMLEETELEIKNFDALALALSEHCLKKLLGSNPLFREIYGYFLRSNKPIILVEYAGENILGMTKLLKRYLKKVANKVYSNILFIYDFTEKDC